MILTSKGYNRQPNSLSPSPSFRYDLCVEVLGKAKLPPKLFGTSSSISSIAIVKGKKGFGDFCGLVGLTGACWEE
ncbi:MAG: hypothetical protein N3B10_02460 [Armatimonadetes bacterium]|nr:hypothetical protein [Armatimonadota bacterium]MCX7967333.1 hypothetical protein [Armatimonadota bacterium]MDW8142515.1 hypothetical protein [Armatimonadota bacterium]